MKFTISVTIAFCSFLAVCGAANAADSTVPEPFRGFDAASKLAINYDDLNTLLQSLVADIGLSNREKADLGHAKTGTRMKTKVQRSTINEGNRFYYETFVDNEAGQQTLRNIQKSIERVPDEMPLEHFTRDEQLAYWLNLYNITVLNEVVKEYPQRSLKKLLLGKNSILSKKLLTVAGVPLSLNDIQYRILKQNYDSNPLIIYGLYQGIIGGPNIRSSAYTGADVYRALTENAIVFINSNRGTSVRDAKNFRVSSFYERNKEYFPDFRADLTAHLLQYLEGDERMAIQEAAKLKADISDWTVTDLGGSYREIGGSLAHSSAGLMGAMSGSNSADSGGALGAASGAGPSSAGGLNPALLRRMKELAAEREQAKAADTAAPVDESDEAPAEAEPNSD